MTTRPGSNLPAKRKSTDLERSISALSQPLAGWLRDLGLPTENVLAPVDERRKVANGLDGALQILEEEEREKARYLSKFTVAVAVGLFDGALNYVWNETISSLRKLVSRTDLTYFFSVAEKVNSRNRGLSSEDDLEAIQDHDLLEVCRRIGLLSDVNFNRLEHVNYMRNHASAAHPSDEDIDGNELLSWLSICLRHVITAEPDASVVTVTRLLDNVRTEVIPAADFALIATEVRKLKPERIDDLLWTLFGLFVDPRARPEVKANVQGIAPWLWSVVSEDRKYDIGARFGLFRKNADIARKDAANDFLSVVDGQNYKDEDSLTAELIEKLDALKNAHFGWDNFYNEYPHAEALSASVPPHGRVPRAARPAWVKVIALGYVGNGLGYRRGVDERALPYYETYIDKFTASEIAEYARLFQDVEFTSSLDSTRTDARARELASRLEQITSRADIKNAMRIIVNAPARTLPKLSGTTAFQKALASLPS